MLLFLPTLFLSQLACFKWIYNSIQVAVKKNPSNNRIEKLKQKIQASEFHPKQNEKYWSGIKWTS